MQSSEGSSAFACLCARVLQVPFDHCEARIVRLARGTRRMGRKKTSKVKRLKGQSWIPDDGSSLRKVETATKRAHRTGEFCGVLLRECAPRGIAPSPPPFPALSLCLFATRRLFKVLSRSFESPYAFGDWRGVAASIFSWDRAASVAAVWVRAHEASGRVG